MNMYRNILNFLDKQRVGIGLEVGKLHWDSREVQIGMGERGRRTKGSRTQLERNGKYMKTRNRSRP